MPSNRPEIGLDVSDINRLLDSQDVAAALGISAATLRSALMRRDDRPVPAWFRQPLPRQVNRGHVWTDQAVEEMLEARRARSQDTQS